MKYFKARVNDPRQGIIIVILVIVSILLYRYFASSASPVRQDIKVVETEIVKRKDINQTVSLIATINAKNSTLFIAQESGILNIVNESGAALKKDDVIAKIENSEIEKSYELHKNLKEIAESQYKRASSLLKTGSYNKNEFEIVKKALINAEKNLADSKIALDKLTFYAPFDGVVGYYKAKSGDHVQIGQKVVRFYNPSSLRADFDIPASIIKNIQSGQKVKIKDKFYNIAIVQNILDEDKHMHPVYVDIECADCVVGENIYVDLSVVDKPQVIVIPYEAVFIKNGKTSVYVVKDNILELRPVELGIKEKDEVEILSGLAIGEEIISKSTNRLYHGVHVKIHKE